NSGLIVRTDCPSSMNEICADSTTAGAGYFGGEVVSLPVTMGQTVFVVVDGIAAADHGDFVLNLDLSAGDDCSDPVPVRVEQGGGVVLLGTTKGKANNTFGTQCPDGNILDKNSSGTDAGDIVYDLTFAAQTASTFKVVKASYDNVLYTRSVCDGAQLICAHN